MKKTVYIILIALSIHAAYAANTLILTFPQIKKRALKENVDKIIRENDIAISKNRYISAVRKLYYPELSFDLSSPFTMKQSSSISPGSTNYNLIGTLLLQEKLPWDTLVEMELKDTYGIVPSRTNTLSAEVRLTQPLFKESQGLSDKNLRDREHRLALFRLAQYERDLIYEAASRYYDLVLKDSSLDLSKKKIEISSNNVDETQRKFDAGLITEITLLRIMLNHKRNIVSYNNLLKDKRNIKEQLARLLNIDKDDQFEIEIAIDYAPEHFDLDGSIQSTMSNDLRLRSIDHDIWKENEQYKKTVDEHTVTGNLTFAYGRDLSEDDNYSVRAGLRFDAPVYKRGNLKRLKENHELSLDNLNLRYTDRIKQIEYNIMSTLENLADISSSISIAEEKLLIAQKSHDIDTERFKMGLITADVLIQTEEDYFNAELELVSKKIEYIEAVLYLENTYYMVRQ
ncbi:TolC family protein [Spirochaetota bacterium]